MDKESYQPMTIGHVAKRGTKRAFFSIFGAESGSGERREQILKQWRVFRERKCNFSLDFPAFGPLVRIGPRVVVWLVPKLGIELLEKLEPVLDSLGTAWVVCVIIYAINYGLGVVGPEIAMDFGSTKWNRC